jgi:DEAD/DEAH box helicase domain-containing protein
LLQAAGQDHIPVNPSVGTSSAAFSSTNISTTVPKWEDRPPIDEVITEILEQDWYQNQIVDRRTFDAKLGHFGKWQRSFVRFNGSQLLLSSAEPDPPLSPTITQALRDSRKIDNLYTHQVAAINAVAKERSVIVSTPTASGKSVIYQVTHAVPSTAFALKCIFECRFRCLGS